MAWIAAAAAIGGALISSNAAGGAADTQANAARNATDTQRQMFSTVNGQQAPYREAGYTGLNDILKGFGHGATASPATAQQYSELNPQAFSDTWHKYSEPAGVWNEGSPGYADVLQKTIADLNSQGISLPASATGGSSGGIDPGYFAHQFNAGDLSTNLAPNYQFQLDQGLGAVRNAANLQGGLVSGNTLKGINDYAQNFAGNAYQNAYNNYTANQSNIFNRLSTIAGFGSAANTQSASTTPTFAGNIGSGQLAQGAASAAGTIGQANALTGGVNNALGWYMSGRNPVSSPSWSPGSGNASMLDEI